jgi:hypothetical protein
MTVPCVNKVPAPRKDTERFIPGPNDSWIVREWASTPHDMEAGWICHVLDGRMMPTHVSPQRWVDETIKRTIRDFVALREKNESERALARAPSRIASAVPQSGSKPEARAALNELCEAYYAPVMAFLRRVLARALATLRQSCATVAKDTILTRLSPG